MTIYKCHHCKDKRKTNDEAHQVGMHMIGENWYCEDCIEEITRFFVEEAML